MMHWHKAQGLEARVGSVLSPQCSCKGTVKDVTAALHPMASRLAWTESNHAQDAARLYTQLWSGF